MSTATCSGIAPNPSVSGVGVRVAYYIISLTGAFIPRLKATKRLRGNLALAAGLNGFALLVSALIQTHKGQLSLYHAILVSHVVTFLALTTGPSRNYKSGSLRRFLVALSTWGALGANIAWSIYVATTAPRFGIHPECNDSTIHVVWFVSVRATVPWLRWLSVAIMGIGVLPWIATFYDPIMLRLSDNLSNPRRQVQRDREAREIDCGIPERVFVATYGIIMLELTVKRNHVGEEDVWSSGQIMSLLLAVGLLVDALPFLLKVCLLGLDGDERLRIGVFWWDFTIDNRGLLERLMRGRSALPNSSTSPRTPDQVAASADHPAVEMAIVPKPPSTSDIV